MKTPKGLPKTIPKRELNLLLTGAQASSSSPVGPHLHLILVLLASTGLRISELCALRLLDIDVEKGELQVFGKGSKERIVVIANATVRMTLGTYIEKHRDMAHPTAPLFCNKWGRAITPKWVSARLKLVAEISGVRRKITPHMFRHTAATLLIEGGVDIRFVQRLLGHSNISTTEIYTHVSDQALRSALELADVMQRFVELSAA
jgi:integrase/recombinase XerD